MSLKGNLQSVDLANVLQMLSINQKEGTLVLFDGDTRKSIYFSRDGVSMLSRGRKGQDSLGRILLRYGVISPEQLKKALDLQAAEGKRLGEVLQVMGAATDGDIQNAIRTQIEEEIYNLFIWKEASFEFVEGPPPETQNVPAVVTFNVNSLIMEAQRRADEWNYIRGLVPSLDEIYKATDRLAESQVTDAVFHLPFAPRVLENLQQGRLSVHELIEQSCAAKFEACKILALLLEQGTIEPVSIAELQGLAQEATGRGDHAQAAKFLSRIVDLGGATPPVNMSLGYALEALDEPEKASVYLKAAAEAYVEAVEPAHAFEAYIRVARALPTDLPAVAQMVEIACGSEQILSTHRHEVIEAGRTLAQSLKELGRLPAALQILHKLARTSPQDLPLRNMLALAYQESGMNAEAMTELEALADICSGQKNYDEAIRYLRRVTVMDRNRVGTQKKIETLSKARDRGKRFVMRIVAFVGVLAVIGGLAWGVKHYMDRQKAAEEAIQKRISLDLDPLKDAFNNAQREFDEARKNVEGWKESAVASLETDMAHMAAAVKKMEAARDATKKGAQDILAAFEGKGDLKEDFVMNRTSGMTKILAEVGSQRSNVVEQIESGCREDFRKALKEADTRPLAQIAVVEKIRGRLQAIGASTQVVINNRQEDVLKIEEQLLKYKEGIGRLQVDADALWDAGKQRESRDLLADFLQSRPDVVEYQEILRFRVRVATIPEKALVRLPDPGLLDAGVLSPRELTYSVATGLRFVVSREGFDTRTVEIPPLRGSLTDEARRRSLPCELSVVLAKVPLWSVGLGTGIVETPPVPTPDGVSLVLADRAGWIHLLAARTGEDLQRYDSGSLSGFVGAPLVTADSVYAASVDGAVIALDLPTLRERWKHQAADGPGSAYGSPVLVGDRIVAAGAGGLLRAWNAATGAPAWEVKLPSGTHMPLAHIRGWVVVFCDDGRLRTVSPADQRVIVVLPSAKDAASFPAPLFGPFAVGEKALLGLQGPGQEFALVELPSPGTPGPYNGYRWGAASEAAEASGAIQDGEDLLLLFTNGLLVRAPVRTGPRPGDLPVRILGEKEKPFGAPVLKDGLMFVATEKTLVALRLQRDGPREIWKWAAPEGTTLSTPVVVAGNYVFVCTRDGKVHGLLRE